MDSSLKNMEMKEKIILNKKDKSKGLIIPKKITTNIAYLSGVFAGDGSLGYRPKKHEYSLKCVGNPKDEKEFYFKVVGPNFKESFGFLPNIKYFDKNTTFGFRIFSKSLVNYLTKNVGLPLGKKYDSLKIPNEILLHKELLVNFIRGVFDTDGSICFKKKNKNYPYYPVISFSSKSKHFTQEISNFLKKEEFKVVERYDYQVKDKRIKRGFTVINRIELNGRRNFQRWMENIGFSSPKHIKKIKKIAGERFELPTFTRKTQ